MPDRALGFGTVATAYERFRPGYPDSLVDLVTAYAGRPVGTALEIGAGTGKATRVFAAGGIAVTATDPDPAMLEELRRHVPSTVAVRRAAFEELAPDARYGLVYAAAALHWTRPEGRWERVAALLEPDGVFASFGGPVRLVEPAVEEAVQAAREPFLDTDEIPSPDGTAPEQSLQWPGSELERSELFADVRQATLERRLTLPAYDFVGYLSTVSAYLELPAPDRAEVFDRILQVLPETVEISADLVVHLARHRGRAAEAWR